MYRIGVWGASVKKKPDRRKGQNDFSDKKLSRVNVRLISIISKVHKALLQSL
jgi:hypothetical protein